MFRPAQHLHAFFRRHDLVPGNYLVEIKAKDISALALLERAAKSDLDALAPYVHADAHRLPSGWFTIYGIKFRMTVEK